MDAPASPGRPGKIQPWHLERLAIVYVRQSSQYQVIHNKESAEVQSGFRYLAEAWGWPASRVIVVDHDQALSATSAVARTGFQWIMTELNLNHVGIILGFQVSRLSRANSDWYHLLERCTVFHTLLADFDGIYDPTLYNDRLLLGLKGTMSEAELHFLKQRLYNGRLNKARRGEQFTSAPTGYVRSRSGNQLELDPDEQVQYVVRLVLDKFEELGSIGALHRYMARNDIKVGVRVRGEAGAGRLECAHPFGARSQANPPASLLRRVLCLRVHPSRPAAEEAGPAWLRHGPGSQAEVAGHDPRRGPRLHHLGSLPGQPATTGLQPLPADHARRTAKWPVAGDRPGLLRAMRAEDAGRLPRQGAAGILRVHESTSKTPRSRLPVLFGKAARGSGHRGGLARSSQRDWNCTSGPWPI